MAFQTVNGFDPAGGNNPVGSTGVLLDMTYDRRRAGLFLAMQNTGSNPPIKVVSSTDMGLNWATSIS